MSVRQISSTEEEKLINNVKKAISMANDGVEPSTAIAKVASDNGYNPDFAERMVAMFNTSKTLSHLKKEAGTNRAADFATACKEDVLSEMFSDSTEKAASGVGELISSVDFMKVTSTTFEKSAAGLRGGPGGMKCTSCGWQGSCAELDDGKCPKCGSAVTQVGAASPPSGKKDMSKTIDRAYDGKNKLKKKTEDKKVKLSELKTKQANTFRKLATYFRTPGSAPFHEVETRIRSMHKQAGEVLMDAAWDFLGNWRSQEKRGSYSERVLLVDYDKEPYKQIKEAFEATEKVAQAELALKKAEEELESYSKSYSETINSIYSKSAGDNTLYIKADDDEVDMDATEDDTSEETDIEVQDTDGESDECVDDASEQYVIEVVTTEVKSAEEKQALIGELFRGASKALETDKEKKEKKDGPLSKLPSTDVENMALGFSDDVKHMSAANTLQDLITYDSVISDYDPEEVESAFNEIARLSPGIVNQPAALRGYLRRFLESSHDPRGRGIESFEAQQVSDIKAPQINEELGEL